VPCEIHVFIIIVILGIELFLVFGQQGLQHQQSPSL
jgi:hypothetical protein